MPALLIHRQFPAAVQARAIVLSVTALLGAPSLWAQERPAQPGASSSWSVGAFASTETSPYREADNERRLLPVLAFENSMVRLAGPLIDLKLPSAGAVAYALRARYALDGYKASDSSALTGMAERKGGLWLGAKADWRLALGQLSAEWAADAASHSGGQQIKLTAEKPMRWGSVIVAPRAALLWQDRDYVNYYFGVRGSEALAGRAAYSAPSGTSAELGLRAIYAFSAQQSAFLDVQTTSLGNAITNSPLVDRQWISALRLGYAYRF